jgi:hypothetical protein
MVIQDIERGFSLLSSDVLPSPRAGYDFKSRES